MHWWIANIDNSYHHINYTQSPDITIHEDASFTGWGIISGISQSQGLWHMIELDYINALELEAIEVFIHTIKTNVLHVRVMCDNVTTIAYISNMGGIKK